MPTSERAFDRGTMRGERALADLGTEYREARVGGGLSQQYVADAVRISRPVYSKIERGKARYLSIVTASRICAVLGLDLWVRAYPGARILRDAPQADRLQRVLDKVRAPLRYRIEVPLPQRADQPTELRAWDAVLSDGAERTALELEMRLHDTQALERRVALKLRDDPVDHFLLVVAGTRNNRRVLREHPELCGLTRLRTANLLRVLGEGRHPPSGIILI